MSANKRSFSWLQRMLFPLALVVDVFWTAGVQIHILFREPRTASSTMKDSRNLIEVAVQKTISCLSLYELVYDVKIWEANVCKTPVIGEIP